MGRPTRSIWESASRPLFVRSVWRESNCETGRSHRRHFILDYEPRERQRWLQCQRQSARRAGYSQQNEYGEYQEQAAPFEDCIDYTLDEYLLLDATKLTLQQQVSQAMANKMQTACSTGCTSRHSNRQGKRRSWLLSGGKSYQLDQLTESHSRSQSRRSSLQDVPTTGAYASNPEERLAERVLNWLDLAGRADIVKAAPPLPANGGSSSSGLRPRSSQRSSHRHGQRSMSLKRIATAAVSQRASARKPAAKAQQSSTVTSYCSNSSNAKPITIIFNKEGVPVRLNRPPRNIELCALSSSASTTRRLAGSLASARLYNGRSATPVSDETRTPPHSSRCQLTATQLESRKQLHIFMPSLPKKGLLLAAANSDDALSNSFNDLCF